MNIALIGYGKMGHIIEEIATSRGHQIVSIIDIDNKADMDSDAFRSADVAIEFTRPESAIENIFKCFEVGVPVVVGTTGWLDKLEEVKA
jgi:4-hydroxy-tetrahydrodipicolinate reductase